MLAIVVYGLNNKLRKMMNMIVYILHCMVVTCDTSQFETSLVNTDAYSNAVQIHVNTNRTTLYKEKKN